MSTSPIGPNSRASAPPPRPPLPPSSAAGAASVAAEIFRPDSAPAATSAASTLAPRELSRVLFEDFSDEEETPSVGTGGSISAEEACRIEEEERVIKSVAPRLPPKSPGPPTVKTLHKGVLYGGNFSARDLKKVAVHDAANVATQAASRVFLLPDLMEAPVSPTPSVLLDLARRYLDEGLPVSALHRVLDLPLRGEGGELYQLTGMKLIENSLPSSCATCVELGRAQEQFSRIEGLVKEIGMEDIFKAKILQAIAEELSRQLEASRAASAAGGDPFSFAPLRHKMGARGVFNELMRALSAGCLGTALHWAFSLCSEKDVHILRDALESIERDLEASAGKCKENGYISRELDALNRLPREPVNGVEVAALLDRIRDTLNRAYSESNPPAQSEED